MTTTVRLVRVPAGDEIDLERPVSGAWQRYYDMQRASTTEAFGNADLISADAQTYRKNCALPASSLQRDESFAVVLTDDAARSETDGAALLVGIDESAAFDDADPARLVGFVELTFPLESNLDRAWLDVWVDPSWRRRGLGHALLEEARRQVLAAGRTSVGAWTVGASVDPDSPGAVRPRKGPGALNPQHGPTSFLLHRGFGLVMVEKLSGLIELDDDARLASLHNHMRELTDGLADHYRRDYELLHYSGATPEDLLQDVAQMFTEFSIDIPKGEDEEPTTYTADKVREIDARAAGRGTTFYTTAARHVPSGKLVAYTTIARRATSTGATQEDTWVHRDHRGHRLGLAIKLANLERFLAASADVVARGGPALERIITWNAEENSHMWAINGQLGFDVICAEAAWVSYYRDEAWHPTRS